MPYRKPLLRFLIARVDGRHVLPGWWLWVGVACFVGGLVLRLALDPLLHGSVPYITFYPALIIAGVWGGRRSGLVTLVLSAFVGAYYWLPPAGLLTTASAVSIGLYLTMGALILIVTSTLRGAVREYAEASERAAMLADEMQHRIQNLLAIVLALSNQAARTAATVDQYRTIMSGRLLALSRAQRLIAAEDSAAGPTLEELIREVLEPFDLNRFDLRGPEIRPPSRIGPSLALLLNELATNATKYGALSHPEGRVTLDWRPRQSGAIAIEWKERGGPLVAEPAANGFGSFLIRAAFSPDQASIERSFEPDGVRCLITLSAAQLAQGRRPFR